MIDILKNIILSNSDLNNALNILRTELPVEAWIGGGAIRNTVWDTIFENVGFRKLNDIDVLYFDKSMPVIMDQEFQRILSSKHSEFPWSVKNQYHISVKYGNRVESIEESLTHWVETATALAVRMDFKGDIKVLAPYGLDDLFEGIIRPTSRSKTKTMKERIRDKKWLELWPELSVVL